MFEEKCLIKLGKISRLQETISKRTTSKFGKYLVSLIPSRCPTGSKETLLSRKSGKRFINSLNGIVS